MERRVRWTLACAAAAALAACGDTSDPASYAPRDATTTDVTSARAAGEATAVRVRSPTAAAEVAAIGGAALPEPSPEALRAMAACAGPDASEDALARASDAIVAAGTAGAAAAVAWLRLPPTDPRFDIACTAMAALGMDAVPVAVALLEAGPEPQARLGALRVLSMTTDEWRRSPLARRIAEAAWAQADRADEIDAVVPERDPGAREIILRRIAAAGRDAADVVDRVIERIAADPPDTWPFGWSEGALDGASFAASGPRLVAMLASETQASLAQALIEFVVVPPEELAAEFVRRAAATDGDDEARLAAVRQVATWAALDARSGAACRTWLAEGDAETRLAILETWAENTMERTPGECRRNADDMLAVLRCLAGSGTEIREAARGCASRWDGDRATVVGAALDGARPADHAAIWDVVSEFGEEEVAALGPRIATALRSPDVELRCAVLRAVGAAADRCDFVPGGDVTPLLDDPDPRVRALAAGLSARAAGAPVERITNVARAAALGLPDGPERNAAFAALRGADPAVRRETALALLPAALGETLTFALGPLVRGAAIPDPPPGAVDAVVRGLRGGADARDCLDVLFRTRGGTEPALAWITEALASDDVAIVLETLGTLAETGSPAAPAQSLVRTLTPRDDLRDAAEMTLAAIDPDDQAALRRFATLLPHADANLRKFAKPRLSRIGDAAVPLFIRTWTADRYDAAAHAVAGRTAAVLAAVSDLVASKDAADREHAAAWIEALSAPDGLAVWTRLLHDPDADVRGAAAAARWDLPVGIGLDARATAMSCLLGDERTHLRSVALRELDYVESLPADTATQVRGLLADPDEDVRALAAATLVLHDLEGDAVLPAIVAAFRAGAGDGYEIWDTCARALAKLGPRAAPAAPVLARALRRAGWESTQLDLIEALGAIGPAAAEAVPILRTAMELRLHLDACVVAMQDDIRNAAIEALGAIGPAAAAALPELRRLRSDARFGDAAAAAIARIEASPPR